MRCLLDRVIPLLLATFLVPMSSGQSKTADEGARLFSANCAACHGSDGHGGERAPSIATLRNVIAMSDADLEGIVGKGLPSVGMSSFGYLGERKVSEVVAYLRTLQGIGSAGEVMGDAQKGHTLFYGKAQCSQCHMVHGDGGFIAEELSSYGRGLSASAVRRAIVEPNLNLEPASKVVVVQTADGHSLTGMARAEDNFTLSLQTEDGRYHMFSKANLKSVRHTEHSIMPADYGKTLTGEELDDLVKFLITAASTVPPEESASGTKHHVD